MQERNSENLDPLYERLPILNPASFWNRLLAYIIDVLLGAIMLTAVFFTLYFLSLEAQGSIREFSDFILSLFIVTLDYFFTILTIFTVFIRSLFESSKYQGTPAKIILKMKVVDKHGNRASFLRSFVRNIARWFSGVIFLIGYLIALFDYDVQTLHDMIASTYVIRKR